MEHSSEGPSPKSLIFSKPNLYSLRRNKLYKFYRKFRTNLKLSLQSVQQKSSEPRLDDAGPIGAIDYVGIFILNSNNLSSHKLKVDGRDACWIPTRCALIVIRVPFIINQNPEISTTVVTSLHNRKP